MKTVTDDTIMVFGTEENYIVNSKASNLTTPGLIMSRQEGHIVSSYLEILTKIAALSYHNSRFQLLFRGQDHDYRMSKQAQASDLYPSMLRGFSPNRKKREEMLDQRFGILQKAEALLLHYIADDAIEESQVVRWAVLQHYQVCATPLLDVTQSLQTALTFAVGQRDTGYLYVLAFPQLNGGVSVSIESKTQVINLSQVCPPEALRPHFQEGLLVSDYPEIRTREQTHGKWGLIGNNFSCRLLTKFKLINCKYWKKEGFHPTPRKILFPNKIDTWFKQIEKVRNELYA